MSEPLHTPGPWMVKGRLGYSILITSDEEYIAVAYGASVTPASAANASLIAAAPDLLQALKAACKRQFFYGEKRAEIEEMEAVIAKAEGRS